MVWKKKKMSQQEVGNNCRVDRARVGKIENAQIEVQHMTLIEIATAMGVELSTLLPANINPNPINVNHGEGL